MSLPRVRREQDSWVGEHMDGLLVLYETLKNKSEEQGLNLFDCMDFKQFLKVASRYSSTYPRVSSAPPPVFQHPTTGHLFHV